MLHPSATRYCAVVCLSVAVLASLSCKGPSSANIELRKQNQELRDEIEKLKRQQAADAATIVALQAEYGSVKRLEKEQLDKLYTVAGLNVGRLTGGVDIDPATPGDDAIRVQVVPTDTEGDPIKAAGTFLVEVSDQSSAEPRTLASFNLDLPAARKAWNGEALQYAYLFNVPLTAQPATPDVSLKITFTDELTGRAFTHQQAVKMGGR